MIFASRFVSMKSAARRCSSGAFTLCAQTRNGSSIHRIADGRNTARSELQILRYRKIVTGRRREAPRTTATFWRIHYSFVRWRVAALSWLGCRCASEVGWCDLAICALRGI